MPGRGKRQPEPDPNTPVSYVLTVDYKYNRVRLPRGITLQLSWLRERTEKLEVSAFPGPAGGLRIWPPDALEEQKAMLAAWMESDAELLRHTETMMEFARYQAAGGDMTFSFEPEVPRFSSGLAREGRKPPPRRRGGHGRARWAPPPRRRAPCRLPIWCRRGRW